MSSVKTVYASYFCFRVQFVVVLPKISVRATVSWHRMYSVLQNVILRFQVFSSEGCGRKRAFTGGTEEYHGALWFDPSVLAEFLARNGLECCQNRLGPYFLSLFPFPSISPVCNYKYRTYAIVAEQIGLTGGLSNFDPETLSPSVSKGFLRSLPAAR